MRLLLAPVTAKALKIRASTCISTEKAYMGNETVVWKARVCRNVEGDTV